MLCVTGAERTFEALAARIERHADAALHEARIDLLGEVPEGLIARLPRLDRLVVTARARREGGGWAGSEEERVARLLEAIEAGAAYVDVEASTPPALLARVLDAPGKTRRVVSVHLGAGAAEAPLAALSRMATLRADVFKLAVHVADAADLAALRDATVSIRRDLVVVGMGVAGTLSRVAFRHFGSLWTYVAADDGGRTAEGQWTLDQARRIGLGRRTPEVYGLLGGPAALRSPGPRVWGELLPRSGRPLAYVALPTDRPAAVVALLRAGVLAGLSVTMPHKIAVRDLIDEEAPSARKARSVNTVQVRGDRLVGHSTDGEGAVAALGGAPAVGGKRIVVLGAGGAAAAFARAAADAGASIRIAARNRARAAALASAVGAVSCDWADPVGDPFDILVNATPLGSDGASSPIADPSSLAGRIVLDMVIDPVRTPLVAAAERAGAAAAIPGIVMWAHQGAAQMRILADLVVDPKEILRVAHRS